MVLRSSSGKGIESCQISCMYETSLEADSITEWRESKIQGTTKARRQKRES